MTAHRASRSEISDLLDVVERDLRDSAAAKLGIAAGTLSSSRTCSSSSPYCRNCGSRRFANVFTLMYQVGFKQGKGWLCRWSNSP